MFAQACFTEHLNKESVVYVDNEDPGTQIDLGTAQNNWSW